MTSFSSFSTAKKKLNPQQKVAVETLEGPVLTIAGPGTGKTQVLALRIAEILKKQPDVSTENILCLTYTNAGVIAMRKRLLSFAVPGRFLIIHRLAFGFVRYLVSWLFSFLP